jgi:hypothetical protein
MNPICNFKLQHLTFQQQDAWVSSTLTTSIGRTYGARILAVARRFAAGILAPVNEVLCKIICHNICCLIQESHELGISLECISPPAQPNDRFAVIDGGLQ